MGRQKPGLQGKISPQALRLLRLAWTPGNNRNRYELALAREVCRTLTPCERKVLAWYYLQQCNLSQIAERLGVDRSTISRNKNKGLKKLEQIAALAEQICPALD